MNKLMMVGIAALSLTACAEATVVEPEPTPPPVAGTCGDVRTIQVYRSLRNIDWTARVVTPITETVNGVSVRRCTIQTFIVPNTAGLVNEADVIREVQTILRYL